MKIQLKRSNVLESGAAKAPTAALESPGAAAAHQQHLRLSFD